VPVRLVKNVNAATKMHFIKRDIILMGNSNLCIDPPAASAVSTPSCFNYLELLELLFVVHVLGDNLLVFNRHGRVAFFCSCGDWTCFGIMITTKPHTEPDDRRAIEQENEEKESEPKKKD
jgi:hypothetical protein